MARRQGNGVNKSAAIREVFGKNPKMPVKDVVDALAGQGIEVNRNLVYLVKSKMRQRKRREKRNRAVEVSKRAGASNPVQLILDVRRLAEKVGGLRRLKAFVEILAE